jgi:hypothetical protein
VYAWDGQKWTSGSAQGAIYVSDSPPAAPAGSLWFENDTGILYFNYRDVDSTQWVALLGGGGSAIRYDIDQTLTETQKTQARKNIYAAPFDAMAYSGLQVNGAGDVDQTGLGDVISTNYALNYFIDGWAVQGSPGATVLASTITGGPPPPGFAQSVRIYNTVAVPSLGTDKFAMLRHHIEGYRTRRLAWGTANAQPVTFAFWVYSTNLVGTIALAVGNGTSDRAYAANVNISAANTWEYKVVTVPGCTDGTWDVGNGTGLIVYLNIGAGTAAQGPANVWSVGSFYGTSATTNFLAGVGAQIAFAGFTVLPGIEAPSAARLPLIMRPYNQELATCMRYLYKTLLHGQPFFGTLQAVSTTSAYGLLFSLPVGMRIAPATNSSPVASFSMQPPAGGGAPVTALAVYSDGYRAWASPVTCSGGGLAVGNAALLSGNSTAYILFDARL